MLVYAAENLLKFFSTHKYIKLMQFLKAVSKRLKFGAFGYYPNLS